MDYDPTNLQRLGREHKRRRDALAEVREKLAPEIRAAHDAGVPQHEIAAWAGYTREVIRQICLTDEQREQEKEKRRQRTRAPE
jgi:hypothetical protein